MLELVTTRRSACVLAAGLMATCAAGTLTGCGGKSNSASGAKQGFSSDTEVVEGPVNLSFCVDSDIQYFTNATAGMGLIENAFATYCAQDGRSEVHIDFTYAPARTIAQGAEGSGFEGYDAVICDSNTMSKALETGVLEAGNGGFQLRSFTSYLKTIIHVVRAKGSSATIPAAKTVDGNDAPDGSVSRLQNIGEADGFIALANPAYEPIAVAVNKILYAAGLYSNETGIDGEYDSSLADKVQVFDSQDEAMAALVNGQCAFGFAFTNGLSQRYPQVEDYYTPPASGQVSYQGAVTPSCSQPGVARDFMQYLTMLV